MYFLKNLFDANNPELCIHIYIYLYISHIPPIPQGVVKDKTHELRILKQGSWNPSDLAPLVCPAEDALNPKPHLRSRDMRWDLDRLWRSYIGAVLRFRDGKGKVSYHINQGLGMVKNMEATVLFRAWRPKY